MIIQPDVKHLLERAGCRYALVVAVSRRARMLVEGDEPKTQLKYVASDKPVSAAVQEIYEDKVTCQKIVGY